jgi:hypothetical protein
MRHKERQIQKHPRLRAPDQHRLVATATPVAVVCAPASAPPLFTMLVARPLLVLSPSPLPLPLPLLQPLLAPLLMLPAPPPPPPGQLTLVASAPTLRRQIASSSRCTCTTGAEECEKKSVDAKHSQIARRTQGVVGLGSDQHRVAQGSSHE